jgi:CHAD domain-containing protein/transposase-like protein
MTDPLLTPDQKLQIEQFAVESPIPLQRRARLLLLYDSGLPTREVASQVELSRSRTRHWRRQFLVRGMEIFTVRVKTKVEAEKVEAEVVEPVRESEEQLTELLFPQPMEAAGILPDDSMAEAGRKIMRFNFAEMLSHEAGTRLGQDSEELHDMRVATRRLRAAFAVFEQAFDPKATKPHLKGLRAAGRALGHARDMDVILEKAVHYLDELPPEDRPGMQPLIQFWQDERAQAREDMLTHLNSQKFSNFLHKFNIFVNTPGLGALPIQQEPPAPYRVREVAPALIYTRLEAVRAYETILANATIAQLHTLRIECKRFRYTVEFFHEVLGEQTKAIIDELKNLQDHLGDLHDADVACQIVRQFLAEWDTRQAERPLAERLNPQPIFTYLAHQSAELHCLMVSVPQAWSHFNRPEFRMNLALAVAAL